MKTRFIRAGNLEPGDTVVVGHPVYHEEQVYSVGRTIAGDLRVDFCSGQLMWIMPDADVEIVDERGA